MNKKKKKNLIASSLHDMEVAMLEMMVVNNDKSNVASRIEVLVVAYSRDSIL